MKKYLFIFNFIFLWAGEYEIKLYETLFTKLFNTNKVNVYFQDDSIKESKYLISVNCNDAQIVLVKNLKTLKCNQKPLFTTNYIDYIHSSSIGVFYWRKARPQIILNKKMIEKYHLFIDKSLQKYLR